MDWLRRNPERGFTKKLLVLSGILLVAATPPAQTSKLGITGTVADFIGAVVPGASATVPVMTTSSLRAGEPLDAFEYARGAATWMLSVSREQNGRLTWPVNETDRKNPTFDLYSGMPGGILLLAQLGNDDPAGPFRKAVKAGVAGLESLRIADAWGVRKDNKLEVYPGLYNGLSGIGWLYLELYRATGDQEYLAKARIIVSQLVARQATLSGGDLWDNSSDIISGAAGTGLFLLRAAEDLKDPRALQMAARAAGYLVANGIVSPSGLKWRINEASERVYPNFSHGSSGIAFFLLRFHEAKGDQKSFKAAMDGALELENTADLDTKNNSCRWYHHEGDGEDLWYSGWCHGPAGTARLFYELYRVNNLPRWWEWVQRSANYLIGSGIPDPPKPINGYWNESVCCGTAGIGDFFVDLFLATKKPEYLRAAERMADHLARTATTAGSGYCWVQAENRLSPQGKDAQTGYAQGAAGIGLFFHKLSRAQRGVPVGWRLPDSFLR